MLPTTTPATLTPCPCANHGDECDACRDARILISRRHFAAWRQEQEFNEQAGAPMQTQEEEETEPHTTVVMDLSPATKRHRE